MLMNKVVYGSMTTMVFQKQNAQHGPSVIHTPEEFLCQPQQTTDGM